MVFEEFECCVHMHGFGLRFEEMRWGSKAAMTTLLDPLRSLTSEKEMWTPVFEPKLPFPQLVLMPQ